MMLPIAALPFSAHWVGFLYLCVRWVSFALLITLSWRYFNRYPDRMNQSVRWSFNHPLLPFLGIVFLNYAVPVVAFFWMARCHLKWSLNT